MSLTGFNRLRRMQQVEAMKPENIVKAQEEQVVKVAPEIKEVPTEPIVEEVPKTEEVAQPTSNRRRNRRTN